MFKQLFLHGSEEDMSIGDVLTPGSTIGKNNNGGKSDHVYIVSTQGYSLSECEGGEYFNNTFEFAVDEAYWWSNQSFIYIVEPSDTILADLNHDVSPACLMTNEAIITHKFSTEEYSFSELCKIISQV